VCSKNSTNRSIASLLTGAGQPFLCRPLSLSPDSNGRRDAVLITHNVSQLCKIKTFPKSYHLKFVAILDLNLFAERLCHEIALMSNNRCYV